ncbi:hemolysin activation/secretion protein [Chroococcidiopsis sp. CCALA 051]|uniref:ShlB/FhaC/HecB family hemolysin secretion/activation protein n=1 Tax=Chroococcidiopsis sp. CCALA 051 TaxID=869949 RepID=UPI000D0CD36B|nr:ShlB/FhaC/HecB family hemolysin secretion/activation protein [Chroococcidiopsis sp. CCALA 051]PSM46831.1 hemolysin activation/secretion protein [Chroococcidiopsis sp. CCALA 051]
MERKFYNSFASLLIQITGGIGCISISFCLLTPSINASPDPAVAARTNLQAQLPIAQTPRLPAPPPRPQDVIPRSEPAPPELPTPAPLPPPEDLLQPPDAPPTPAPIPGKIPEKLTVKRFEVTGSTVFSPQDFEKVLAPFTNRSLSFAELFQARTAVTQLYIDKGYITSGALIPPQAIQDGVVKIQVVEGGLEAVNIQGTRRLRPSYIRDRIPQATPLNQQRLLEALQLLQLNPLIQNLSAELSAGTRAGTSVLDVTVKEADTFDTQIVLDNGRSPSVGSFRRRVQLNQANLLGFGDGLSFAYSNTDGSNSVDSSYTIPVNAKNGTVSLNVGFADSNVIEPPFDDLEIDGNSRYFELSYRQPLLQSPNREFALGLTAARRESEISSDVLEEFDYPSSLLSPGADEDGDTRISAVQFFQEWTQRNTREVIAARSQFNLGVGAFDATINSDAPDSRFFSWQGQAQWVRLLAPDTLFLLRTNIQIADDPLVPLEQFGVGGLESVRGYRQDALLSDGGLFASAELRIPVYRVPERQLTLQVTPFVDFGTIWNEAGRSVDDLTPPEDEDTLVSVGLGLRFQLADTVTARLDWGIPLVDIEDRDRTWQENGVYFSVNYSLF